MTCAGSHPAAPQRISTVQPKTALILAALAFLAVLSYWPLLAGQPFIADDYDNLWKARFYAPVSGWKALSADPVHFFRPVLLFPTYWFDRLFGPWPPAFYALSILLHVAVTWLIYALGSWEWIGKRISAPAAAFFAVQEGHQEAVMWYSAAYELFLAIFLLAGLLAWTSWLKNPEPRPGLHTAALLCFLLALASKESAVMMIPLLLLPLLVEPAWRPRGLRGLPPFLVLAAAWYGWMFFGPVRYPRLGDGSFSLRAPFVETWLNSFGRLLWPYGLLALVVLLLLRERRQIPRLAFAAAWISIALAPYCFLLYMPRIPSRQTYLASIGLSWILGAAFVSLWDRYPARRKAVAVASALVLALNIGYLWTRKRSQYLERARPTEALIEFGRKNPGPVRVVRFPYPHAVALGAWVIGAQRSAGELSWEIEGGPPQGLWDFRFVTPAQASADPPPATR